MNAVEMAQKMVERDSRAGRWLHIATLELTIAQEFDLELTEAVEVVRVVVEHPAVERGGNHIRLKDQYR